MTRMPARIHRMFELIHKSIRSYEFSASGMQSARWPASGAQPPVRSGHRAISSCAAVERSGHEDRLLAFTASSRTSFQQGSPVSPASIPLGIDSPKSPPTGTHPPTAGPCSVHRILCTRHGLLRSLYTGMRLHRIPCTQNPVYTAG